MTRLNIVRLEDRLAPATLTVNTNDGALQLVNSTLSFSDALLAVSEGNANLLGPSEKNQITGVFGDNDTIRFSVGGSILLTGSVQIAEKSVVVDGTGSPSRVVLNGQGAHRVFEARGTSTVLLRSVEIANGKTTGGGGGILGAVGTKIGLDDVSIFNCAATSGAGVLTNGALTVQNSRVFNNSASETGGGLLALGSIFVVGSTIADNIAPQGGGGIQAGGNLEISASTLSGNNFGAVNVVTPIAVVTILNSTIADNASLFTVNATSGIRIPENYTGSFLMRNSTVSGANPASANGIAFGKLAALGTLRIHSSIVGNITTPDGFENKHNAIISGNTVNMTGAADGVVVSSFATSKLGLSGLADNGGRVKTMALAATSPLVNGGSNVLNLQNDARDTGFARVVGAAADIGAFEVQNTPAALEREFSVGQDGGGNVRLYNPNGSLRFALNPFGAGFTGGVRTAAADFTGDGIADLVAASGPGIPGQVLVFDGVTAAAIPTPLPSNLPFGDTFTRGILVSAGDLNGDGRADLVISAEEGGGARVRVFTSTGTGFTQRADFIALIGSDGVPDSKVFRGGSRTAVVDLDGDQIGDLAWAAGAGGGPRVAVFSGKNLASTGGPKLIGDFFALDNRLRDGCFLAGGDFNGDGFQDLVAGGGSGAGPEVVIFDGKQLLQGQQVKLSNFFFGDPGTRKGVRVAVKDLDGDSLADLVLGSAPTAGSRVAGYLGKNITLNSPGAAAPDFEHTAGSLNGVFVG